MLGGAAGSAGGGDLETPEGWKRRRRRRRRDARSSVGVCRARPGPQGVGISRVLSEGARALASAAAASGLLVSRAPGGGIPARALSTRVAGWRDGGVGWDGGVAG